MQRWTVIRYRSSDGPSLSVRNRGVHGVAVKVGRRVYIFRKEAL
jgi:hypothetical protein